LKTVLNQALFDELRRKHATTLERTAALELQAQAAEIEKLRATLRTLIDGDVGRQTLAKLADGQETNTDDGRAWMRAVAIMKTTNAPTDATERR
jgi:hypothetical protein